MRRAEKAYLFGMINFPFVAMAVTVIYSANCMRFELLDSFILFFIAGVLNTILAQMVASK